MAYEKKFVMYYLENNVYKEKILYALEIQEAYCKAIDSGLNVTCVLPAD